MQKTNSIRRLTTGTKYVLGLSKNNLIDWQSPYKINQTERGLTQPKTEAHSSGTVSHRQATYAKSEMTNSQSRRQCRLSMRSG